MLRKQKSRHDAEDYDHNNTKLYNNESSRLLNPVQNSDQLADQLVLEENKTILHRYAMSFAWYYILLPSFIFVKN